MVAGVPQLLPGPRVAKLDLNPLVRGLNGGLVSEHDGGPGKLLGFLVPFVAVVGGGFVVVAGPRHSAHLVVVPEHDGLPEIQIVAGGGLGKLINAEHLQDTVRHSDEDCASLQPCQYARLTL